MYCSIYTVAYRPVTKWKFVYLRTCLTLPYGASVCRVLAPNAELQWVQCVYVTGTSQTLTSGHVDVIFRNFQARYDLWAQNTFLSYTSVSGASNRNSLINRTNKALALKPIRPYGANCWVSRWPSVGHIWKRSVGLLNWVSLEWLKLQISNANLQTSFTTMLQFPCCFVKIDLEIAERRLKKKKRKQRQQNEVACKEVVKHLPKAIWHLEWLMDNLSVEH